MSIHPVESPEAQLLMHQLHAAELRQRAAVLREQAERAKQHAFQVIASAELRRRNAGRTREQAEFAAEQERGTEELAAYITGLRREQEMLRAEAALQQDWFRKQVLSMLDQGWSREALAETGFSDAFLADLGLQDAAGLHSTP